MISLISFSSSSLRKISALNFCNLSSASVSSALMFCRLNSKTTIRCFNLLVSSPNRSWSFFLPFIVISSEWILVFIWASSSSHWAIMETSFFFWSVFSSRSKRSAATSLSSSLISLFVAKRLFSTADPLPPVKTPCGLIISPSGVTKVPRKPFFFQREMPFSIVGISKTSPNRQSAICLKSSWTVTFCSRDCASWRCSSL